MKSPGGAVADEELSIPTHPTAHSLAYSFVVCQEENLDLFCGSLTSAEEIC